MHERQTIARHSIAYLLLCFSGVALYVFWGIVPLVHTVERLDAEIREVRATIEKQKIYHQLVSELQARTRHRPLPETRQPGALAPDRLDELFATADRLAENHSVKLIAASPDLQTIAKNDHTLAADIVIGGEFSAFRGFLAALVDLPYLDRIESLAVEQGKAGKRCQVKVRLRLAKGNGHE